MEELEWKPSLVGFKSPLFLLSATLPLAFLMLEMRKVSPEVCDLGLSA